MYNMLLLYNMEFLLIKFNVAKRFTLYFSSGVFYMFEYVLLHIKSIFGTKFRQHCYKTNKQNERKKKPIPTLSYNVDVHTVGDGSA